MSFALRKLTPLARRLRASENGLQSQALGRRLMSADAHGEVKVNFWQAPTNIPAWKEEQIVLGVLSCWGLVIYGSMAIFGGKKAAAPSAGASSGSETLPADASGAPKPLPSADAVPLPAPGQVGSVVPTQMPGQDPKKH